MNISDSIYGNFSIEPVLRDLINTKEVQRLKQIHQGGSTFLVNPKWNVTRYEHSVGTMLLIRLLGGSIKEQIAGLLHDISHTAFSHVVDFALDNKNEDYHEHIYCKVIENSNIPKILANYGYDYKDILFNESKWTILEKSSPSLCADRVDYTLRDMYHYGFISKNEVNCFLKNIKVYNGEIVITSIDKAEWFVDTYYKEVIDFFMNPLNIYSYNKLSQALKIALKNTEITLDDLLKDDFYVLNLLKQSKYKEVLSLIEQLNYNVEVIEDTTNFDIYQLNKLRTIDPTIFINNSVFRSSELSKTIQILNHNALKKSKEGSYIKVLKYK